jgi:hypothetical protein
MSIGVRALWIALGIVAVLVVLIGLASFTLTPA